MHKSLLRVWSGASEVKRLHTLAHGKRPLRNGLLVLNDALLLGEYWPNPDRQAVRILRISLTTGQEETLYRFEPGRVRHIHALQWDPWEQVLWVGTGDRKKECMIARLDARSAGLQVVGSGTPDWRTVSFAFRPDTVYWGTDAPAKKNHIWRLDRATGQLRPLGEVIGPVYYSRALRDYLIFATSVEGAEGSQDGYGRLYAVDRAGTLQEVWREKKDAWHPALFGYGVFEFADGLTDDHSFWVTTNGFQGGTRSLLFEVMA